MPTLSDTVATFVPPPAGPDFAGFLFPVVAPRDTSTGQASGRRVEKPIR